MSFHIIFSFHDTMIYKGPGDKPENRFESFEEAKKEAIEDLEHWLDACKSRIEEIKSARSIEDLSRYQTE